MNAYDDKTQKNKNDLVPNIMAQKINELAPGQVVDNSPKAIAQRKLQETADTSPVVSQLRTYQEMADKIPKMAHVQLRGMRNDHAIQQQGDIQMKENKKGVPDTLKTGIENLSGYEMDDVKVQYNSGKPAQLHPHAFAQGTAIHLGPGKEKHMPHEAWHVVQQKQGRVNQRNNVRESEQLVMMLVWKKRRTEWGQRQKYCVFPKK